MGGKSHGLCGVLCFLELTQISQITRIFLWVVNLTDCVGFVFFRAHTDLAALTDFFVGGKSHGLCVGGIAVCGETCQRHVAAL